jgi:hypothetical protein
MICVGCVQTHAIGLSETAFIEHVGNCTEPSAPLWATIRQHYTQYFTSVPSFLNPVQIVLPYVIDVRLRQNQEDTNAIVLYINTLRWSSNESGDGSGSTWVELTIDFMAWHHDKFKRWPTTMNITDTMATLTRRFSGALQFVLGTTGSAMPGGLRRAVRTLRCFGLGDGRGTHATAKLMQPQIVIACLLHSSLHSIDISKLEHKKQLRKLWFLPNDVMRCLSP